MLPELLEILDTEARERLSRYLGCLGRWSPRINLTGAEDAETAFATLIAPVLGAENFLTGKVVDVGSGNGSPGLVLSALRRELPFLLLEPRAKRWAFLREAAREMGASNVEVVRLRRDQASDLRADTITLRAVALDPSALRPLLAPGGRVLIFGGLPLPGWERWTLPSGAQLQRRCFT